MLTVYDNGRMRSQDRDTIAEAWRLQKQGIDATNAGRPADGARQLRAGLDLLGWRENHEFDGGEETRPVVARLLISLAYAEAELGKSVTGLELLGTAEEFVAPEHVGVLESQRGLVLWRAGKNVEALDCFSRSEPLLARFGPIFTQASTNLNRGTVLGELGRYAEARESLSRCAELAREHDFAMLLAKAWHSQGLVEQGLGDIPTALRLYAEAERLYDSVAPDMAPLLAISTAIALRGAGLRHEAAARLDEAIHAFAEQGRERELLNSEVQRARVALDSAELTVAETFADRARNRAQDLGSEALSDWAEHVLREARFRMGRIDDDFAGETLALAKRQRALKQTDIAELAQLLAARAFIRTGKLGRAELILLRRNRSASLHRQTADLTRQLARAELAIARHEPKVALRQLRTGLTGLHRYRERFGSLELQTGVASIGADLAELGLGLALDSGRPATVFGWSERSRAQAFRVPSVSPPLDPEAADLVAQLRIRHDRVREAEQEGKELADDRGEIGRLERTLRERSWQLAGPGDSVPEIRAKQVHEELADTDSALVSFLRHNGRLHALTLVNGRTRLYGLGQVAEADEALRRLLADLNALTGRRLPPRMTAAVQSSIRNQSERLEELLLGEFRNRLRDRELVMVPTGLLTSLPWGLLPSMRGRPVTVAPSAAVWWDARRRLDTGPGRPLLASGPDLTHAETELATIAGYYADPVLLQGEAATPAGILSALDGAPIAHLAAHGSHEPDNVLFSRLDFDDGSLMAHDIARLATPPAHVTLSACDVGQATVATGDETLGFTAALLYAGTRTVVSSVAKIEHEAAADIMTAYHRGLVAGRAPAHAIAEASLRQPLSPFVCYGAG